MNNTVSDSITSLTTGEQDHSEASVQAVNDTNVARPTRLAFCTRWALRDEQFDIYDEFNTMSLKNLPFEIGDSEPVYVCVFWEGFGGTEKPWMRVVSPLGVAACVLLPPLKSFHARQVQVVSLTGFTFEDLGLYKVRVTSLGGNIQQTLTLTQT